MESTGFDATAAKIAILQQRELDSSRQQEAKEASRPPRFADGIDLSSVITGQLTSENIIHQFSDEDIVMQELMEYQGYQYDEDKGFGSTATIYQDKDTPLNESSDPYNPKYYEVAAVQNNDLTREENERLVNKISENKLDPTGSYQYFQEDQTGGSMKLEYGVSSFDWKTMRGLEDHVYSPNDPSRPRYITHDFSANGSITTNSGKEISFNLSYTEQLHNGIGIIAMRGDETLEEFDIRAKKESSQLNQSQSDYRAISFNFESSSALTKQETDMLNEFAQRTMRSAENASQGIMANSGYKLSDEFNGIEGFFKSMEMNAHYIGSGQNETKMTVEILDQTINSDVNMAQHPESDYNMERFWQS